jgi:hypothetical protein
LGKREEEEERRQIIRTTEAKNQIPNKKKTHSNEARVLFTRIEFASALQPSSPIELSQRLG